MKKYKVIIPDYTGEEGTDIQASSPQIAAERLAMEWNDDGDLVGDSIDVDVIEPDGTRKKYNISAEISIDYFTKEIY